jgi:hypothetical protein
VWAHSAATVAALAIDAPGHVPWWPRPEVTLFNILVHMLAETARHAGHADILREQLDGAIGTVPGKARPRDEQFWADRRATIENAARASRGPAAG